MACTLKKFLCCLSLETGGFVIGWINIIFSVLMLIGMITGMSLIIVDHVNVAPIQGFACNNYNFIRVLLNHTQTFSCSCHSRTLNFDRVLLNCFHCCYQAGERNEASTYKTDSSLNFLLI